MTGYSTPLENVALLQRLVEVRQEMAELMGARSYAHYALGGGSTLAGSPEAVQSFLQELAAAIRPQVTLWLHPCMHCKHNILHALRKKACILSTK